jgi:uncharacterized small protein (DUF1192 family)
MASLKSPAVALSAALMLVGCSYASDTLFPSLDANDPASGGQAPAQQTAQPAPQQGIAVPPPAGYSGTPAVSPSSQASQLASLGNSATSSTFVGQKIGELRSELSKLQSSIASHNDQLQQIRSLMASTSAQYHASLAGVTSRLQVGTTPGNPNLIAQWNEAQSYLSQLEGNVSQLNALSTGIAADATMAAYLHDSSRSALALSGAVDEDHQQLALLEDEVERTNVLIQRLLDEVNTDITRQNSQVGTERANMTALAVSIKNGELYGKSFAAQPNYTPRAAAPGSRPLVIIKFDSPNVAYQQPLFNAVNQALKSRPNATFEVVAVAPGQGGRAQQALDTTQARQNADGVLRSLTQMGLPSDRIVVSSRTSPAAANSEVHVFVR